MSTDAAKIGLVQALNMVCDAAQRWQDHVVSETGVVPAWPLAIAVVRLHARGIGPHNFNDDDPSGGTL